MPVYARADLAFERGEGLHLYTADGTAYLDMVAGIGVNALGHGHPHLVAALKAQADKVWHTSNLYRVPGQESVARRLIQATFADTVFFTNSGVEAWECGIKVCRRHFYAKGQPQKWRVITIQQSFHGRTLSAIAAAKQDKLVKGFGPMADGYDQVSFGNLNELRAAITPETCAINLEPTQGEGGIREHDAAYLQAVRATCDEFGLLLFLDEIQTGMGRTGKLFAHEWAGVAPDVMSIAKGIGGGFPVGACLATAAAAAGMDAGSHGSTFGGNPLAMAVAGAVLDVMLADGFLDHVRAAGAKLRAALERLAARHPAIVREIRGSHGLMLGLRLDESVPAGQFVAEGRRQGVLTVSAGNNVVRLLPPLTIDEAGIEEAETRLGATLDALTANQTRAAL